jgi:hypothetical protein
VYLVPGGGTEVLAEPGGEIALGELAFRQRED